MVSDGVCAHCDKCTDKDWQDKFLSQVSTKVDFVSMKVTRIPRPATPAARISVEPIKPLSDIGTKLRAILASYGITEAAGCPCKAMANRLNAMTKDHIAENLQQLAQELAQRLKNMPQVANSAPWWVRAGIGLALADPTQLVAIEAAKRLIRKAME